MIWCILNEIFAGRVYGAWKKLGQKHQELIHWSKLSAGHAHGSSDLANLCCQGVLLPQALIISFTFVGPKCGDCHLMGLLLPLEICAELQSAQRPRVSISSTSSGGATNPKGLLETGISQSLVWRWCSLRQKPAASFKHGSLTLFWAHRSAEGAGCTTVWARTGMCTHLGFSWPQ